MVAVALQLVDALPAEPRGDQRDAQAGVQQRVLAGQHPPGRQDQAVAGRDEGAPAVPQEGEDGQMADAVPGGQSTSAW
ncbi:MAG TPA: hypothetical protein VE664_10050 [Actinomycetes bacterium]|nr:hypothetical protein [Actinomycetes bacterium]